MKTYISDVKQTLFNIIKEMANAPEAFVIDPRKNFKRKRVLDFEVCMKLILSLEGNSLVTELLNFFNYSPETISSSAFYQQRSKILPIAFEHLFRTFSEALAPKKNWNGYRLLACDGSDLNTPKDPSHKDSYYETKPNTRGYNQLHLNALYDICNDTYVDAIIQNKVEKNEFKACIDLINRLSDTNRKTILLADRGYENYNLLAHAQELGLNYVIRVKDIHSNGILSRIEGLPEGSFDEEISFKITRSRTKEHLKNTDFKTLSSHQVFDFLPLGSKEYYQMNFRVVRFPLSENSYECIVTNLSNKEISIEQLKELYHKRWDIETSFRELKYSVGLNYFHSKKQNLLRQEIFAKLIIYNFCKFIANSIERNTEMRKKHYGQINFSTAISICKRFLKDVTMSVDSLILSIKRNTLPLRPGRSSTRKVRTQTAYGFGYRLK